MIPLNFFSKNKLILSCGVLAVFAYTQVSAQSLDLLSIDSSSSAKCSLELYNKDLSSQNNNVHSIVNCKGIGKELAKLIPIEGDDIYLPINEGKLFKSSDATWREFLNNESYNTRSSLTMPFVAVGKGNTAVVYVFNQAERTQVEFKEIKNKLQLSFSIDFINPHKTAIDAQITAYTCLNDITDIAKTYAKHVQIQNIPTLLQRNSLAQKLIGAPHFYLWDQSALGQKLINELSQNGINKAWIGFDEWRNTKTSQALVKSIIEKGYLAAVRGLYILMDFEYSYAL